MPVSSPRSSKRFSQVRTHTPKSPSNSIIVKQTSDWSAWVWSEHHKVYYRGTLGPDDRWEYEYAGALVPAIPQDILCGPLMVERKEQLAYDLQPMYTFMDPHVPPLTTETADAWPGLANANGSLATREDEGNEEDNKSTDEPLKSFRKSEQQRVQKWAKVVDHLERQERERKMKKSQRRGRYGHGEEHRW